MTQELEKNHTKGTTPPYISAVKLTAVMDYVSSRNLSEVSVMTFIKNDFSRTDAVLAINALKFLGFIDDAGKSRELMTKLRLTGEARKVAFEKIVKEAYKKLFDVVPAPQDLSPNQLVSDLRIQYDLSKRVADSAATALMKLMEFAGLKEETAARKANVTKKDKKEGGVRPKEESVGRKETTQEFAFNNHEGRNFGFHIPIVEEKMYLEVPEKVYQRSLLNDELHDDLRALVKEAHQFAKKHIIQNETPNSEEPREG